MISTLRRKILYTKFNFHPINFFRCISSAAGVFFAIFHARIALVKVFCRACCRFCDGVNERRLSMFKEGSIRGDMGLSDGLILIRSRIAANIQGGVFENG